MPRASLIILAYGDAGLTGKCLLSLAESADSCDREIIVFDNGSEKAEAKRLLDYTAGTGARLISSDENLGFAAGCNAAAAMARGDVLVFLNNDIEAQPGWLEPLLTALEKPEVGIAGSLLLYPGGSVQHAGTGLGLWGLPAHIGRDADPEDPELQVERRVLAVTGACLAVPLETFSWMGGFDESYFFSYEDVDLCLRARARGLRTTFCPASRLIHHESATEPGGPVHAARVEAEEIFLRRWNGVLERAAGRELSALKAEGVERVAIFGTGRAGKNMLRIALGAGIEVACFLDSRPEMEGSEVEGLAVRHPSRMEAEVDAVLGASMFLEQIRRAAEEARIGALFRSGLRPDIDDADMPERERYGRF